MKQRYLLAILWIDIQSTATVNMTWPQRVLMLRYFITKEQNSLEFYCLVMLYFPVFMMHTLSLNIELFVTWVFL